MEHVELTLSYLKLHLMLIKLYDLENLGYKDSLSQLAAAKCP